MKNKTFDFKILNSIIGSYMGVILGDFMGERDFILCR